MSDIIDKNGISIGIGDVIRIGDNRYSTIHKIESFYVMDGGSQVMAKTKEGDFNVKTVVKCA